ncbi:MAG: hypothetical protein D6770_09645 [Anaerolineae bacterium]|nr:MAG: hypothetical protein D6770_09645 [Anaerolineae bacterium]
MPSQLNKWKEQASVRIFSLAEEIAHSITHGVGAALSLVGLILLIVRASQRGDIVQVVSFSIYGTTLVLLYLASTLYHAFRRPRLKRLFKIFDHAAIYLLIAGTYTPFLLVGLRGEALGWTLLALIWGIAVLGVSLKALFIERLQVFSVILYVLMGWLSVVFLKDLVVNISPAGVLWLAAGGVLYTVGVIFYALQKIPYMHVVWHIFVLGGSLCHYLAVLLYLAPKG